MKTNKIMRIASLILVAVMLSTCAISGTFAKYVTSGTANDTARVAKFGVNVVAASGASAFAKTYASADTETYASATVSADEKVVAPGTSGNLANFSITGTTEVAVQVSYAVTALTLTNWTVGETFYCPITITVGTTDICGLNYSTADAFITAVKEAATALTIVAPKGEIKNSETAISWAWAFEGATGTAVNQSDANDTLLGRQAEADNAATIAITVTCTVTQVD